MSGKNAYWTSELISLPKATSDCINQKAEEALEPHKNGGVSEGGLFAWLYHGSQLEVFSAQTGERLAAWCFGLLLKDPTTTICCCVECVYGGSGKLILGTDSVMGNMILVFDVVTARVTKSIQMPYKVTSICVISTPTSSDPHRASLGTHLQHLAGVLAVGTHCGHVYLIDMNLDDENGETDELNPAVLSYLNFHVRDIRKERDSAVSTRSHLCFQLNEDSKRGTFYYRKPDDEIIKSFPADSVCVSSLCWCPRTGQLAVGFSFGSFQLWRLSVPVMEYTGRYEDDLGPVSHFVYQEPDNDPRNFCYLWVSRGALPSDHQVDYNSYMTMYQLGFNKKHWHEGSGYMLEDLVSVGPRFEYELSTDPFNASGQLSSGSRLVSCYTLRDPSYRVPHRHEGEDSFEEGGHSPDLSLCLFVWEAGYADAKPSCYLAVFDMNRWYHAQMPYTVRPTSAVRHTCSYFAFYNLSDVMNTCDPAGLMDVHIPYSSLSKFHSLHVPAPEQHFYPSALSFDSCFLAENGLVHCKYLGAQEKLLADVQQTGPSLVLDPTEYYVRATLAALLPRTIDVNTAQSQVHKREALLSVALEYGRLPFLNTCVTEFGSGDFMLRGCSLRFFLEWAWKKVGTIKQEVDRMCHSLYDWSGVLLDKQTLQVLHQHHSVLCRLVNLLTTLQNQPSTPLGHQDLEVKVHIATLLSQHLQMVLWLYSVGFLPENSDDEVVSGVQYAFPLHTLAEMYRQRRNDVRTLHSELQTCDILHIDGLVGKVGEPLHTLLNKDGGTGLYPFSSFHSLLDMYLLEEVSFKAKLTLTFYVLCDLYSLVEEEDQQKFSDKLQQFAQMFSMSVSLQKYVQGIWLLDHKDFKDSLTYLQDPGLSQEVESWQHTITLKAFLYQGQHRLALRYMRVVKPPLQTPEDIKLRLTVLLANGLTSEAFEYQRLCRDQVNADDLLSHLFVGSLQTKTVDQLLQLPFTEAEEHHLVSYLKTNTAHAGSQELLVLYYLQRSRFIEAIRLNAKIRHESLVGVEVVREMSGTRNCIVEGYQRVLPYVQRKLAFGTDTMVHKRQRVRREFTRPTPLSTTVNRCVGGVTVTRATLLQSVLEKTKEVRADVQPPTQDMEEEEPVGSRPDDHLMEEPGPFVCTPMTDKVRKRVSETSEVVFTKTCQPDLLEPSTSSMVPKSPGKQSLYTSFHGNASPYRPVDTLKSLKKRLTSAADLTLLHTPPVKKRTPPSKRTMLCRLDTPKTPQSILKVRQKPLRRSPSPLLFAQEPKSDLVMATPPVPKTRLARIAASQGPASPVVAFTRQETPKKLRFSMPGRGETPTPTKEFDEDTPPPSTEKPVLAGDHDVSPTARPPIREAMEMEEESDNLDNGQHWSPGAESDSPKLTSQTDFIPTQSSLATASEMMVDSDISFNITDTYSTQKADSVAVTQSNVDHILDLEAMEEGESSEDKIQEVDQTEIHRRELSFDRLKHKEIEASMRKYKDTILTSSKERKGWARIDMTSSEEEHREAESSEEEHKEAESSEEEHKEAESSEEEHKEAESSEEEHKEVFSGEEEHKEAVLRKEFKKVVSNVEEHKEAESIGEELNKVESSGEEFKEVESIEKEHEEAESVEEEHKEMELSEEEHKEAESIEEELKEVKSSKGELEKVNIFKDQTNSGLLKDKDFSLECFRFREPSKVTCIYTQEKHISFSSSSTTIQTFDTRKATDQSITLETDTIAEDVVLPGRSVLSASSVVSEDSGKDGLITTKESKQKQSVISGVSDVEKSSSRDTVEVYASGITVAVSEVVSHDNLHHLPRDKKLHMGDEYEALHLQLDNDDVEGKDEKDTGVLEDVETTPKSHGISMLKTLIIDLTPVNMVTKEPADSSEDQSKKVQAQAESLSPKSSESVRRNPGRRTPTRRTPTRVLQEQDDLTLTPRRRSMRLLSKEKTPEESQKTPSKTPTKPRGRAAAAKQTPNKRDGDSFKTPPRPTRLAMPPTPPESSPASTTSVSESQEPDVQPSPKRGRGRPRKGETTPPRASRTRNVRPRSRSGSPPVVTSTTEDLPGNSEVETNVNVSESPLSSQSFMMSLRTEQPSREPSPQFSEVSNQDDMEFTFSKPEELQAFNGEVQPDLPTASFIFSPPMTRQRTRRFSLTPTETSHSASTRLSHSINLLPELPEIGVLTEPVKTASKQTPAKRPRRKAKTLKSGSPLFKPSDSPINFVPEPTEGEGSVEGGEGPSGRGMTLRIRNVKSKAPKSRKKPIMW